MSAKRWGGREDIPFEVVAEHFVLPIVEASAKLGICSATLKRVCKEHGIPRWPYRKVMAGKTIEEIKSEAVAGLAAKAREGGGGKLGMGGFSSTHFGSGTKRLIVKLKGANISQGSLAAQGQTSIGGSLPPQAFSTFSPHPNHPPGYPYPYPTPLPTSKRVAIEQRRNIHSFADEFRLGFPSKGLAMESYRWWGRKQPAQRAKSEGSSHGQGRNGTGEDRGQEDEVVEVNKEVPRGTKVRGEGEGGGSRAQLDEVEENLGHRVEDNDAGRRAAHKEEGMERGTDSSGEADVRVEVGGSQEEIRGGTVKHRLPEAGERGEGMLGGGLQDKAGSQRGRKRSSAELQLSREREGEVGRLGLGSALARGYGVGPMAHKDWAVLDFVFGEYCPRQWFQDAAV